MDTKEWAKLQESLLKSQLKTLRQFLVKDDKPNFKPRGRGRSQMSIVYDILLSANKPLHINEIIALAKQDFHVILDRESLVSSITKKVKSGRMFTRVAPNTFKVMNAGIENAP